eukprot:92051_1
MAQHEVIDMSLNNGFLASEECKQTLVECSGTKYHQLSRYTSKANDDVIEHIAKFNHVDKKQIVISNGSGFLLFSIIPYLLKQQIKKSITKTLHYVIRKKLKTCIITTNYTYSKVPLYGSQLGLPIVFVELSEQTNWVVDMASIEAAIQSNDSGVVYLCNPNNPIGSIIIQKQQVEYLVQKYPQMYFYIDEAYIEYVADYKEQYSCVELTKKIRKYYCGKVVLICLWFSWRKNWFCSVS